MKKINRLGIRLGGLLASLLAAQGAGSSPKLAVERSDSTTLRLSWPRGSDNLVLEESERVGPGAPWHPSLLSPVLHDTSVVVTVQATGQERYFRLRSQNAALTKITETSPAQGDDAVAVTRETILRFSGPLAANTTLTANQFHAEAAGRRILSRIELASDRRTATLFYLENLPGATRVRVTFDAAMVLDETGQALDADADGQPGGTASLEFNTLGTVAVSGTAIIGRVFASELKAGPDTGTNAVNRPLQGVTITVDGSEETLRTTTDAMGNFILDPCPAGRFFVHVDGRTANGSDWPNGAYYPFVGKAWEAMAGSKTNIASGTGMIYLPLIVPDTLQAVSATADTSIAFPDSVLQKNPALAGVFINVPANALLSENGVRGGRVGIAPVPPDRLPEKLPPGLNFPLVITVQTDGPANFDRPVPVRFPNLPDPVTGKKLAPGAKSALWSFDHDTGRWEIQGPMTVSADGKFIESDPGVGIRQPGWHGTQPGTPGDGPGGPPEPPDPDDCGGGGGGGGGPFGPLDFKPPCRCPDSLHETQQNRMRCVLGQGMGAAQKCVINNVACKVACVFLRNTVARAACKKACDLTRKSCEQALDDARKCKDFYDNCLLNGGENSLHRASRRASVHGVTAEPFLNEFLATFDSLLVDLSRQVALENELYAVLGDATSESDLTSAQKTQVEALMQQIDAHLQGKTELEFYGARFDRIETLAGPLVKDFNLTAETKAFYALEDLEAGTVLRGQTLVGGGFDNFILRPDTHFRLFRVFPGSLVLSEVEFSSAGNGQRTAIPRGGNVPDLSSDTDGDGLSDTVEFVLGTDPGVGDSDQDGITDGAEVSQGTDPNSGLAVATGVVASADTPGNAVDICASNDLAIIADSEAGVAVFNIFSGLSPTLIAQVDTPGNARAVVCSGKLALVADDTAGLAIIDLSVPAEAQILRQVSVGGVAQAVAVAGGIAYVGLSAGQLVGVDVATGTILERTKVEGEVHDVAVEGENLFCLLANELRAYRFSEGGLEFLGTSPRPSLFAGSFNRLRRLFVGGGYAYVAAYPNYDTFDVRNPAAITKVGTAQDVALGPNSFKQIVANGSGLGIAAVGAIPRDDGTHDVHIYDVSDPAVTTRLLSIFPTPGITHALTLYNGLVYAADGNAGLQVVNYLSYDNKGIAPTINLGATFSFNPPRAEENKNVVVSASVTDDVQVRNVEFYIDGQKVLTDGNFPFEFPFRTPSLRANRASFRLRAKATDTGGNATWTPELTVNLVPDGTPPVVKRVTPRAGGKVINRLTAYFSESIAPASLRGGAFSVFAAGPNERFDTSDDVLVSGGIVSVRNDVNAAVLSLGAPLPDGLYRAVLSAAITDLAGNHLSSEFAWYFRVADAVFWMNEAGGSWDDALNWSTVTLPGPSDHVIIDVGIDIAVRLAKPARIRSLILNHNLTIDGGAIQDAVIVRSADSKLVFTRNGQNVLDNVTLEGGLDLSNGGFVRIRNGLRLTTGGALGGIVRIDNGGSLGFDGTQTFGAGIIEFGGNSGYLGPVGNSTLTLGSGVVVHGKTGHLQPVFDLSGTPTLINQGTISSDVANGILTIAPAAFANSATLEMKNGGRMAIHSANWSNAGTINAEAGSDLSLNGGWVNSGTITVGAGSTFTLNGDWSNTGTIQAANTTVNLNNSANAIITLAKLGNFSRVGATMNLLGTLENDGQTLPLDATSGNWILKGGTIRGGTVTQTGGAILRCARNVQNVLDGVTVEGGLDFSDGGFVRIRNGLTLTTGGAPGGTVRLDNGGILGFDGTQTFGPGIIEFGANSGYLGPAADTILTLSSGVLVRGKTGFLQAVFYLSGTPTLINRGIISADVPNGTLTIATTVFANEGTLEMKNGGQIVMNSPNWSNAGTIQAAPNSILSLNGAWVNNGTISTDGAAVNLNHSPNEPITLSKLGKFNRNGGTVNLFGTLENAGETLALNDVTGSWVLNGGMIHGGTISQADGARLIFARNGQNVLDGVTMEGGLDLSDGGFVRVRNGLTLTSGGAPGGTVRIDNGGILGFEGTQTFGPGIIEFGANSGYMGPAADTILTLSSGVLVRGKTGYLQPVFYLNGTPTLINRGTISADVPNGTLTITTTAFVNSATLEMNNGGRMAIHSANWSNTGTINAAASSDLSLNGSWVNTGTITVGAGSTFTLNGDWSNTGTIQAANTTVNLNNSANAAITLARLGNFSRAGATVNLLGTLDNISQTLLLDAASGNWILNGGTIKGGTVTQTGDARLRCARHGQNFLDGVTVEGGLDLNDGGILRVRNGLTLKTGGAPGGTVRLDNGGILGFEGTQTLAAGTIEFGSNGGSLGPVGDTTLTLGNGVLVHGKTGHFQAVFYLNGTPTLINQGMISADVPNGTLTIATTAFANEGTLEMKSGGQVTLNSPNWSNAGTINAGPNSIFSPNGAWANTGTINTDGAVVNLNHSPNEPITLSKLGKFNRNGGTVILFGTLENAGETLALNDVTGSWVLNGGTIRGGTVSQADGARLILTRNGQNILDGVTVEGGVDLSDGGFVRIRTGLTLTTGSALGGTVRLDNGGILGFDGTQTLAAGTIEFLGHSGSVGPVADTTLTLGSGVLVHGKTGYLEPAFNAGGTPTLINQGIIRAEVAQGTITIRPKVFINEGALEELNGGKVVVIP